MWLQKQPAIGGVEQGYVTSLVNAIGEGCGLKSGGVTLPQGPQ